MLTFHVEAVEQYIDEAMALLRLHWDEVCARKDAMKVDPEWDVYRALERQGDLLIVTARDGEKLVGYIAYTVRRHLHYRGIVIADEDVRYLLPAYRRGTAGIRLIEAGEKYAIMKAREKGGIDGSIMLASRVKSAHDHSAIYKRRGYIEQDIVLTKIV